MTPANPPLDRATEGRAVTARKTVARRVLASFGVTVIAFAVTVGWSGIAQRRPAEDSTELAHGYVPVALKLVVSVPVPALSVAVPIDVVPE